jgi:hypothetical protein
MATQETGTLGEGTAAEPPALVWAPGPGYAYPATAGGVPLSAFAFAFAVGFLGLVVSMGKNLLPLFPAKSRDS